MVKILIACVLSAILYRFGGAGKNKDCWDFLRNSKTRDIGCSLLLLGLVWALFGLKMAFWWVYVITFGLSWAALSTYWDWLFGYDNFYAHGLGCGLAAIPLLWADVHFGILAIRLIICTVGMGLWSKIWVSDIWEERGRGFIFII